MANGAKPGLLVPPRNASGVYPVWPDNDNIHVQPCMLTLHYNPIIASIFGLYIAIGTLYTFAGKYRKIRSLTTKMY